MENLFLALIPKKRPPVVVSYLGAALLVAVAFGLRIALEPYLRQYPLLLFFPAIFLSALLFDRGAGLFAAALSAALSAYFLIEPVGSLQVSKANSVAFLLFVGISAFLAAMTEVLRHALQKVAAADREKDILLRELAHRTKNDFMTVASILRLQAHREGEPARTALNTAVNRVQVIAQAHEKLQRREDQAVVNAKPYLEDLCGGLEDLLRDVRPVAVRVAAEPVELSTASAVPVGLIVNELVTNAFKYAFPDGRGGAIDVAFKLADPDTAEIEVRDDGVGCPTTARDGLGSRLVRSLAQQMKGTVDREAVEPGCRVVVRVRLQPA